MVLSHQEIDAILNQLSQPYRLFVSLLSGCGLLLFECLQLQVQDFNFAVNILTVHGKGNPGPRKRSADHLHGQCTLVTGY